MPKILIVQSDHPHTHLHNPGTSQQPLPSIQSALRRAYPGDTILVRSGIYRERVAPIRSGEEGQPIRIMAETPHQVFLRGSEIISSPWLLHEKLPHVYRTPLTNLPMGENAYRGWYDPTIYGHFNPFIVQFDRNKLARPISQVTKKVEQELQQLQASIRNPTNDSSGTGVALYKKRIETLERYLQQLTHSTDPFYPKTGGQVFVNGIYYRQVEYLSQLTLFPETWMVSPDGDELWVPFSEDLSQPEKAMIEGSVRHTVFAPLKRGLGFIHIEGLVIEHGANHFPTWGANSWPQVGLLSCRSGHHWTIRNNIIRYGTGIGVDCGTEGDPYHCEASLNEDFSKDNFETSVHNPQAGYHWIEGNQITDNGLCGIAGIGHRGTRLLYNIISRNNRDGWTSPWWEFGGVKFHFFFDGLIEGNLVCDNDAHGIWLDNQWRHSRVTRNLIINNQWSGINIELGRGPLLIDHNIIMHTRQGDGIYGHDTSDVTMVHNLIYANANFGIWFAYCTPRVKAKDGCWDLKIRNNMILGNRAGAIGLPFPFEAGGNNDSDYNLLMGAGEYLDEGSGPRKPLFQITNVTHTAPMIHVNKDFSHQTPELVIQRIREKLSIDPIAPQYLPNWEWWKEHYLVSLELWQHLLGNDQHSHLIYTIKDGLSLYRYEWNFDLDEQALTFLVPSISELKGYDFYGNPYPSTGLVHPGPFQNLKIGKNSLLLWPIPRKN